jgi:hypothetical protein
MGCRCQERREALGRVASAVARGQMRTASREVSLVGRTAVADLRAVRQAAVNRLALRMGRR